VLLALKKIRKCGNTSSVKAKPIQPNFWLDLRLY
jgi:hypothetical protein